MWPLSKALVSTSARAKALTLFGDGGAYGAVTFLKAPLWEPWGWVALVGDGRRRWCGPILAWIYVCCLEMGSRGWRSSFGVVVALMAEDLPRLTPQAALKMDQWKMATTTHVSASDRFVPRTR